MHPDTVKCALCHDQCASACPVFRMTGETTAYPSRKGLLALTLERGELGSADAEALFSACIGCHLCRESCVWTGAPVDAGLVAQWARSPAISLIPADELDLALAGGWGASARKAGAALAAAVNETAARKAGNGVLIWIDPTTAVSMPRVVLALADIARHAGLRPVVPPDALPSGLWALRYGHVAQARDQASATGRTLAALSAEHHAAVVIATSPADVWALRTLVPEAAPAPVAAVEWLDDLVSGGRLRLRAGTGPVAFQDPASLARGLGNCDSARRVLEAMTGQPVVEMASARRFAQPAAPEGPAPLLPQSVREQMAQRRLDEARQAGASVLVTTDPDSCIALRWAATGCSAAPAVEDICTWVATHLLE